MSAREQASKVRLMAFDVDGVMTDGTIYYTDEGVELKGFNALDGAGMKMLERAGIVVAIITGRKARCVELRAQNLGIARLHQGIHDKAACMQAMLDELGLAPENAGYMGDDVMDLPLMAMSGFSAAPADAHPSAQQQATLVTKKGGGRGAVRETCDFILAAQGKLDAAVAPWLPQ